MSHHPFFPYDRITVLGIGKSGVAAANLLARRGHKVRISDPKSEDKLRPFLEQLDPRVEIVLGRNDWSGEVSIISPGIPAVSPLVREMAAAKHRVLAEIELAYLFSPCPIIAITGTDGKTTTTSLTGALYASGGCPTVVGGNIGTPLCEQVESLTPQHVWVAEVSCFQLLNIDRFRPRLAALLNLAPDHLDHHGDFNSYCAAKARITENQESSDILLHPADHPEVLPRIRHSRARRLAYGHQAGRGTALWLDSERRQLHFGWDAISGTLALDNLKLRGHHNHSNVLAAVGLALAGGCSLEAIQSGLDEFQPLPHRIEPCGTRCGVEYFDDSKATSPHAAMAALQSLNNRIVLIAGGYDKQLDFTDFGCAIDKHCRAAVLIGQTRRRIAACIRTTPVVFAESMEEAVERASGLATPGDVVLLSPACSSFDMFADYEDRGRRFQACVTALSSPFPRA